MESAGVTKSRKKRKRTFDTDAWRTPRAMYKFLYGKFEIIADVAAAKENSQCFVYFTKEDNALLLNWTSELELEDSPFPFFVFCNPPFSRDQPVKWLEKAYIEMLKGLGVIMILPWTGQLYWEHLVVARASKIYLIHGRVPYGHPETGLPYNKCNFTSAIIIFDPRGRLSGDLTEWISQDIWNKL